MSSNSALCNISLPPPLNKARNFPEFHKLQKERQAGATTNPGDHQLRNCPAIKIELKRCTTTEKGHRYTREQKNICQDVSY